MLYSKTRGDRMDKDYRQEIINIFGTDDIEELKQIAKSIETYKEKALIKTGRKKEDKKKILYTAPAAYNSFLGRLYGLYPKTNDEGETA
jgi:hypothetical protein